MLASATTREEEICHPSGTPKMVRLICCRGLGMEKYRATVRVSRAGCRCCFEADHLDAHFARPEGFIERG
jgi:hypothetical protein